jgi:hypothetical protein
MIIKVKREIPFEYYRINFKISPDSNFILNVATLVKKLIQNSLYLIANIGIGAANTLKLYHYTKMEVKIQTRPPFYNQFQAISAYGIISVKAAEKLIGQNNLTYFANFIVSNFQFMEGTTQIPDIVRTAFLGSQLFLRGNFYYDFLYTTCQTYAVVKSAYNGIRACHKYWHHDPKNAIKGVIFHIVNIANILNDFNQTIKLKMAS